MKPEKFIEEAKKLVAYCCEEDIDQEKIKMVWACKTLQNCKAIFCIVGPGDNRLFEATLNGDENEIYLDAYNKSLNVKADFKGRPDGFPAITARGEKVALNGATDFAAAIRAVKRGYRIKRAGWNGKNQYIQLASCCSYRDAKNNVVNCEHEAIGSKCLAFVGTSGVQLGWLASQADMLAEDWIVMEG